MKDFFKNKKNIFYLFIILACIVGIAFILLYEEPLKAIDFSNLKEKEVIDWFDSNKIKDYEIKYEYSDTIEKDFVISQSVKADKEFEKIIITISKGEDPEKSLIELPDIKDMNRDEIEKFFKDNNFTDVTYEYQKSELPKDTIIKLNVSGKVNKDTLILVTLSAGNDDDSVKVVVPNFTKYSLIEAEAWAKTNSITLVKSYALSKTYERGSIMSQSVKEGEEIASGSSITLGISDGQGVTIPDFSKSKKSDVEKWVKENKLEDVKYETSYSDTIEKDYVISTNPKAGVEISLDYPFVVKISLGKKVSYEIKTGYEGKSVDELKKYISEIDSSLKLVDSKLSYYSKTIASGKVHSYDLGTVSPDATIKYHLSLGSYSPKTSDYEGLSKNDANNLANSYINKKADFKLVLNNEDTTDSSKVNKTYGCSLSGTVMTCKIGVKTVEQINANDYNGLTAVQAENKLNEYKNKYGEGSLTLSYGNASSDVDKTYGCSVSGKNKVTCKIYRAIIDANDYNGLSKDAAKSKLDTYKNKYGVGSISFNDVTTDSYTANLTYGCSLSGNAISCNVAKAVAKAEIMNPNGYWQFCKGDTFQSTKAKFMEALSQFTNVNYVEVYADDSGYPAAGDIYEIVVGGVSNSYTPGEYPLDVSIVIKIGNGIKKAAN